VTLLSCQGESECLYEMLLDDAPKPITLVFLRDRSWIALFRFKIHHLQRYNNGRRFPLWNLA